MSAKDAQIPSHQSQPAVQRAPPSDWMCTVAGTPPRLFAATKCPRELRRNSHQQIAPNEGLMSHYIASGERASQPSIARTGMVVRQKKIGNKKGGGEITSANPLAPHPECDTTRQQTCHPRTKEPNTPPHEAHVGCCHTVVSRCAAPKDRAIQPPTPGSLPSSSTTSIAGP